MLFLKYSTKDIQERIEQLYPIELRLQAKKGINNCLLIGFNNDPSSYKSKKNNLKTNY